MSINIYLVEDHPMLQYVISAWINNLAGMTICGIANMGQEALVQISLLTPDLVITDISLPDMSGIDVVHQLQIQSPSIPTLMLSSYEDASHIRRALAAGARGYVIKKFPEEIEPAIRRVLAGGIYLHPHIRSQLGLKT